MAAESLALQSESEVTSIEWLKQLQRGRGMEERSKASDLMDVPHSGTKPPPPQRKPRTLHIASLADIFNG